jgi:hypothetical protein
MMGRYAYDADPAFVDFWQVYPKKKDKAHAFRAWLHATHEVSPSVIIAAAERYRDQPGRSYEFTKYPSNWIRGGCWDDEQEGDVA